MTSDKKDTNKRLAWVFGIVVIGLAFSLYNDYLRTLPHKYASGTIYEIYKPPKGGPVAAFKYTISGKEYVNSRSISGNESLAKVGSTFLVEYPIDHKGSGVLLFENPVPPNVTAPYLSWDSKPSFN